MSGANNNNNRELEVSSDPAVSVESDPADAAAPISYVHPDAASLFEKIPVVRKIPLFGESAESYGPKCVASLGIVYFFAKGIANNMLTYSRYPMFRGRYGIDATRYQRLAGISKMGWSIKAFAAMISDTFALFGYTKRWYMFGACFIGGAFLLGYALLPAKPSSADVAAGFGFLASYAIANIDILSEGHFSRLMRILPSAGPAMVSWTWWWIMIGGLIASAINGPLSDANLMQVGLYVAAGSLVVCFVFFLFNWYCEEPNRVERARDAVTWQAEFSKLGGLANSDEDTAVQKQQPSLVGREEESLSDSLNDDLRVGDDVDVAEQNTEAQVDAGLISCCGGAVEINTDMARRSWRVMVYSGLMTAAVIVMTLVTILGSTWDLLYACVAVSVVCCAAGFWALPLMIAKANLFAYLQMVLYLQLPGALDSFYLATPECLPDGPHFTYTFYNTVAALIGNVGGLVGVAAFNYIFSKHSFRLAFVVTTIIQILASFFDLIMVERWNVYVGIPDHAMYILGDAVVYEVCYYLAWMPMCVLLSRICPRGSEAMVFAVVAGFSNLGSSMSNAIGSLLMELVWTVDTESTPCDFSNVRWLLIVGHLLLPILIIPCSILLIPPQRLNEDLPVEALTAAEAVRRDRKKKCEADSTVPSSSEPVAP